MDDPFPSSTSSDSQCASSPSEFSCSTFGSSSTSSDGDQHSVDGSSSSDDESDAFPEFYPDDPDDEFELSPGAPDNDRDWTELFHNRAVDRTDDEMSTFAQDLRTRQKAEIERISKLPFATRGDLVYVAVLSRHLYGEKPVHDPTEPIPHARNVFRPLGSFFRSYETCDLDPGQAVSAHIATAPLFPLGH